MTVVVQAPGPPGHWLKGNLAEFRRDMLAFFSRCARAYGDVVAFRLGPKQLLLLSHPDAIEQVLVTENRNFAKHYILQWLRPLLGNGLLLSEGDFWLRQRRLIQPAFQRQRVEAYAGLMVAHAQRLLAGWQDGAVRDLHADMMRLALGIAAEALLGVDVSDESGTIGRALEGMMHDFSRRFERLLPIPRWLPTPRNVRVKQAKRQLDAVIHDIIARRRAAGGGDDLLSTLVQARDEDDGRGMTDQQLRDEVMTLFLAGHETTANALAWTWYLLAQHPEVEARLQAELQAVLAGRPPTAADLPRLVYAERVVQEAMRLYPPVYAFGRQAIEDCEVAGHAVPAGTTLIMSQWVVHRDPRYFDEPERFDPDRWADGLARRLPKYAYFPFGGGPRVCIGNAFAMMEVILIVATIAPRFRFTLLPGREVKPWPSVTLRPAQGIRARLTSLEMACEPGSR